MESGLKMLVVEESIDIDSQAPQDKEYHPIHLDAEENGNLLAVLYHIMEDAVAIKNAAGIMMRDEDAALAGEAGNKFFCFSRATQCLASRIERYADLLFSELDARRRRRPEPAP